MALFFLWPSPGLEFYLMYRKDTEHLYHAFVYSLVSYFFPVSILMVYWMLDTQCLNGGSNFFFSLLFRPTKFRMYVWWLFVEKLCVYTCEKSPPPHFRKPPVVTHIPFFILHAKWRHVGVSLPDQFPQKQLYTTLPLTTCIIKI